MNRATSLSLNLTIILLLITGCFEDSFKLEEKSTFVKFYGQAELSNVALTFEELQGGFLILGNIGNTTADGVFEPLMIKIDSKGQRIGPIHIFNIINLESGTDNVFYEFKPGRDILQYRDMVTNSNKDIFILNALKIDNLLNNKNIIWLAVTKISTDGFILWRKFYPSLENNDPVAILLHQEQLVILSQGSGNRILLTYLDESGNLVSEKQLDFTNTMYPSSVLSPRGMVKNNEDDFVILCDGYENLGSNRKPFLITVSGDGKIIAPIEVTEDPELQFTNDNERLDNFIKVGIDYYALTRNTNVPYLIKFGANNIQLIISLGEDNEFLEISQISPADDGDVLVTGAIRKPDKKVTEMFLWKYNRNIKVLDESFGPPNIGTARGQKAIHTKDGGFAIVGDYILDGNEVIVVIKTNSAGKLVGN